MKSKKVHIIIFSLVMIAFIAFFFYFIPTYVQIKYLGNDEYDIWLKIREVFDKSKMLNDYYCYLRHKTSINMIIIALIVNAINMFFGYFNFKKKAWYYVVLCLSWLISLMLVDGLFILYFQE